MKKLSLIIIMFFMIGCAGVSINASNSNDVLIKITAIKFGQEFAKENPGEVDIVMEYATFLQDNATEGLVDIAKNYLVKKVDDPVDKMCLEELLKMIVVKDTVQINPEKLKIAVEGFVTGLRVVK